MLVDTQEPQSDSPKPETPEPPSAPPTPQLRVRADLHEEYSADEIARMTELYEGTLTNIEEGEIVLSRVLRVTDTAVILDVGFKSEGAVSIDEFKDPKSLKEGDEVEVFLEHLEDQEGAVVLSKKKADFMRVWERIREAYEKDEPVAGALVKKIKGGVVVDLMGVDAFLPGSQIALRRVPNIDELLGQSFEFKIIKLNKRRRNIVVSRRVLLEAERKTKRDVLMKELQVNQVRKGVVKNITDWRARSAPWITLPVGLQGFDSTKAARPRSTIASSRRAGGTRKPSCSRARTGTGCSRARCSSNMSSYAV
jgi:small subunit ribosomal protein S1